MECPTCLDVYSEQGKLPRSLDCGHTFCESCLNKMKAEGTRNCPSCRKRLTHACADELPTNFIALKLAQQYHRNRDGLCTLHTEEPIRFYCNSCSTCICAECIILHSGHHFVKHQESRQLLLDKAKGLSVQVEERVAANKAFFDSLDLRKQELAQEEAATLRAVQANYSAVVSDLDARAEAVKASYARAITFEENLLESQLATLRQHETDLLSIKQTALQLHEACSTMTDTDFAGGEEAARLHDFKESVLRTRFPSLPALVVPQCIVHKQLADNLRNLGRLGHALASPTVRFFGGKNKLLSFNIAKETWSLKTLPGALNYYAAATTLPDGSALITGGSTSNAVFLYKEGQLVSRANMRRIRKEHAVVTLNDYAYAIGGYDSSCSEFLGSCEQYDLRLDVWVDKQALHNPRCAFSATVVNDQFIFVFGGYDGQQRLASIEKYCPLTDAWDLLPYQLKMPLSNCACFSPWTDEVVVLGGGCISGFSLDVEVFNIVTGTWRSLPRMTEGRDLRNKVCVYNNEAFCAGGYNCKAEKLNLSTGTWASLPSYMVNDNLDSWACALTFTFK